VGKVLVLEKAPEEWLGGNSYFTAGAFRVAFGDLDDLAPLLDEVDEDRLGRTELPAYGPADFMADMQMVTGSRCDVALTKTMVDESTETVRWLADKGLRWRLMYDRQAFLLRVRGNVWDNPHVRWGAGGWRGLRAGWKPGLDTRVARRR
jgi:tricarballylate dehydrogenase